MIAPSEADDGKFLFVGVAAHICAAAEGGPRFDPRMTPEERRSASNGLFLCGSCSILIDKNSGLDFPADLLRRWKEEHEKFVAGNLNKRQGTQQPTTTFNVTSFGQLGGITAGVVNVAPRPRRIDDGLKSQLSQLLPDKTGPVTVNSLMGGAEAYSFATQIKEYLTALEYQVRGVMQCTFSGVVPPQSFDPATRTITIGGRQ
jgi:hypothetical protein